MLLFTCYVVLYCVYTGSLSNSDVIHVRMMLVDISAVGVEMLESQTLFTVPLMDSNVHLHVHVHT